MMDAMQTGRFILDMRDGISIDERVMKAAKDYFNITNNKPNLAYLSPRHFESGNDLTIKIDGYVIRVISDHTITKHITYIGMGKPDGMD